MIAAAYTAIDKIKIVLIILSIFCHVAMRGMLVFDVLSKTISCMNVWSVHRCYNVIHQIYLLTFCFFECVMWFEHIFVFIVIDLFESIHQFDIM